MGRHNEATNTPSIPTCSGLHSLRQDYTSCPHLQVALLEYPILHTILDKFEGVIHRDLTASRRFASDTDVEATLQKFDLIAHVGTPDPTKSIHDPWRIIALPAGSSLALEPDLLFALTSNHWDVMRRQLTHQKTKSLLSAVLSVTKTFDITANGAEKRRPGSSLYCSTVYSI